MNDHAVKDSDNKVTHRIEKIRIKEDHILLFLTDEKLLISEEAYFRYHPEKEKVLSEEQYQLLKDEEKLLKAYRGCLRKISRKDHTIYQIRQYLAENGLNGSEQEELLSKLQRYGLLDDEKYCISRIAALEKMNQSSRQIRHKLEQEGISDELIGTHLQSDAREEYERARKQAEKLTVSAGKKSNKALKQKIFSRLLANGFSYETASDVLKELKFDERQEQEALQKEYLKIRKKYEKKYEGKELNNRIFVALASKGFSIDRIRRIMEE